MEIFYIDYVGFLIVLTILTILTILIIVLVVLFAPRIFIVCGGVLVLVGDFIGEEDAGDDA